MHAFNLAVIGDIHYPLARLSNALDDKIFSPPGVVAALGKPRLSILIDDLIKTSKQQPFDAILFVGDFTTGGSLPDFKDALIYFSRALQSLNVPLIGVPGNHDLKKPQSFSENSEKSIEFERAILDPENKILLAYSALREFPNVLNSSNAVIYALNSCSNCLELWQSTPKQALANYISGMHLTVPDEELYDYFDAPFLETDSITSLVSKLDGAGIKLPILLAHHNILPQKIPRVAIFPEMLNAGFVRHTLASTNPPVVYIHGHVHDDSIDVIANPTNHAQVGLVTVSAPLATDGYIQVRVLTADDDTPLAVNILQKRIDKVSMARPQETCIQLYGRTHVLSMLPEPTKRYLDDLQLSGGDRYDNSIALHGSDQINKLEIAGLISITRPTLNSCSTWRVRCSYD
ncbi:hypothetical protein DNX69_07690 [Rhodopseudomonas palustris]|uniref:Calcineurin-like phosphoesterase domain-containing protein n=1 Tax=Rhodopseudomonas palustris TaxID=1076 RepID=A0A323UKT0_RHOPL|nr:metallophosphoesterase [Rhodopseudomonas palustris]PZA12763.1 hypothetical protein DNX69_07690 [Rhodopseudomonas palustris]